VEKVCNSYHIMFLPTNLHVILGFYNGNYYNLYSIRSTKLQLIYGIDLKIRKECFLFITGDLPFRQYSSLSFPIWWILLSPIGCSVFGVRLNLSRFTIAKNFHDGCHRRRNSLVMVKKFSDNYARNSKGIYGIF